MPNPIVPANATTLPADCRAAAHSAEVVHLHAAATDGTTVAYGRHGQVQVFVGQDGRYADAREGFERVLSFEPRSLFFLIETADAFHYVRAGRA